MLLFCVCVMKGTITVEVVVVVVVGVKDVRCGRDGGAGKGGVE